MKKIILMLLLINFFMPAEVFAYKVYWYDSAGNRVYKTIEQKDFARYKNAPKRSYVRKPRTNWEMSPAMRSRKRTSSQFTHRY